MPSHLRTNKIKLTNKSDELWLNADGIPTNSFKEITYSSIHKNKVDTYANIMDAFKFKTGKNIASSRLGGVIPLRSKHYLSKS